MKLPILFHGTSKARATKILKGGFKRAKRPSYTGTATNFSTDLTVCWEYGDPFNGGSLLKVSLRPETTVVTTSGEGAQTDMDSLFKASGAQACRTSFGHLWLVWDSACVETVETLERFEALRILAGEIIAGGPEMGYNADVGDYATIIWRQPPRQSDDWYREELKRQEERLRRVLDLDRFWRERGLIAESA